MTRDEHLLTIAAEECTELAQRLLKAQRFGLDQVQSDAHYDGKTDTSANPEGLSNRERIVREYAHLEASMKMLGFGVPPWDLVDAKREKVERFLWQSAQLGTLSER